MSNSAPSAALDSDALDALRQKLASDSPKKQLPAVQVLADAGEPGWAALAAFARDRWPGPVAAAAADPVLGRIYQSALARESPSACAEVRSRYPGGAIALPDGPVDYQPLQDALARQDFEEADRLTRAKMCERAGDMAVRRKWLYFTEVDRLPPDDLRAIDALWRTYSEGKFGYSVQRELWLGAGKSWEKLWPKIGWKSGSHWTRYPTEFDWSLDAPRGHMPLTNQLRGVRVMNSLMTHPAWSDG